MGHTIWDRGGSIPSGGESYSGRPKFVAKQTDKNTSNRPLSNGTANATSS